MRNQPIIFLLGISMLLTGFSMYRSQNRLELLESELDRLKKGHSASSEESILMDGMQKLQRFSTKLWFAGQRENWELANFYVHELEEVMEELEESNVKEGDLPISELIRDIPRPALSRLAISVRQEEVSQFKNQYQMLVHACNACHSRSGKPFIKIQVPTDRERENQTFSVALP